MDWLSLSRWRRGARRGRVEQSCDLDGLFFTSAQEWAQPVSRQRNSRRDAFLSATQNFFRAEGLGQNVQNDGLPHLAGANRAGGVSVQSGDVDGLCARAGRTRCDFSFSKSRTGTAGAHLVRPASWLRRAIARLGECADAGGRLCAAFRAGEFFVRPKNGVSSPWRADAFCEKRIAGFVSAG